MKRNNNERSKNAVKEQKQCFIIHVITSMAEGKKYVNDRMIIFCKKKHILGGKNADCGGDHFCCTLDPP